MGGAEGGEVYRLGSLPRYFVQSTWKQCVLKMEQCCLILYLGMLGWCLQIFPECKPLCIKKPAILAVLTHGSLLATESCWAPGSPLSSPPHQIIMALLLSEVNGPRNE